MKTIISSLFLAIFLFVAPALQAADLPGSKDYPLIKRFEGSEIIGYKFNPFNGYELALGDQTKATTHGGNCTSGEIFNTSQTIEGAVTRLVYSIPPGHSSLEIFRNYEQALVEAKFQPLYESPTILDDACFVRVRCQNTECDALLYGSKEPNKRYLAAKLSNVNGKDIYISLLVGEKIDNVEWLHPWGGSHPIQPTKGSVIAMLDVVEIKAMDNNMVFVKSTEMADAISKTGKIDIYGITFDIDKTDIKSESVPTLVEVAKLLTENPTLKLEISGHTDNTGSAPHNQTLSEGRAASVVNTLVSQYHIDTSRVVAKGYGDTKPVANNATEDGRAKNRRVELKKI